MTKASTETHARALPSTTLTPAPRRRLSPHDLAEANRGLVYTIVERVRHSHGRFCPEYEDLIQAGYLGLLRAAGVNPGVGRHGLQPSRFDPEKGKFSTYACAWIWKEAMRYRSDGGVGRGTSRAIGEHRLLRGAGDVADEVSARSREPLAADRLEAEDEACLLLGAINRLPPRWADIVRRRRGIGGEELNLVEIGKLHGISRERVRQIQCAAESQLPALIALERGARRKRA